jgi:hypothetical protein
VLNRCRGRGCELCCFRVSLADDTVFVSTVRVVGFMFFSVFFFLFVNCAVFLFLLWPIPFFVSTVRVVGFMFFSVFIFFYSSIIWVFCKNNDIIILNTNSSEQCNFDTFTFRTLISIVN